MIIVILAFLGLCMGSFVNALVWRLREQETHSSRKKPSKHYLEQLSIARGRSMCPNCKHELAAMDLLPILSWLGLKGRCRYCAKPISAQYPLVELATALLFVASYVWWPVDINGAQIAVFSLWLVILVGLVALLVYDLRWMLLPNRIIYPLAYLAAAQAVIAIATSGNLLMDLINSLLAVAIGGGIFYGLFQVSGGKWIGGGDVKLGWLLGLILATPAHALLMIFTAALLGSAVSLPLIASKRLKRSSTIPFGPFLIIGAIIVQLFGTIILEWYRVTLMLY